MKNYETHFVFAIGFIWGVIISACVYGISLVIPILLENANDSPRTRYPDNSTCLHQPMSLENAASLIRRGANVNAQDIHGITPLHNMLYHTIEPDDFSMRQFGEVNLLLLNGANPNIQDEDGRTPLHSYLIGHSYDHREIPNPSVSCALLSCLLNAGADLHIKDKLGKTPLDYVSNKETQEFLRHWKSVYSDEGFTKMMPIKTQEGTPEE